MRRRRKWIVAKNTTPHAAPTAATTALKIPWRTEAHAATRQR
jgi:hypothetical protein